MRRDMSTLEWTGDVELRRAIREHARTQEGYDARLYDLWEEWNASASHRATGRTRPDSMLR
jgi:hypothetical protein